jgi:hypothetical protein
VADIFGSILLAQSKQIAREGLQKDRARTVSASAYATDSQICFKGSFDHSPPRGESKA